MSRSEFDPRQFPRPTPEQDDAHELFPDWLKPHVPQLYATENQPDPLVVAKFFTPDSSWTWYMTESDGQDISFGLVDGLDVELGYFSLQELQDLRGPMGLQIERDLYFDPTPLSEIQKRLEEQ